MQSHLKLSNSNSLTEEACQRGSKQLLQKLRQTGHLRLNCLGNDVVIVIK